MTKPNQFEDEEKIHSHEAESQTIAEMGCLVVKPKLRF